MSEAFLLQSVGVPRARLLSAFLRVTVPLARDPAILTSRAGERPMCSLQSPQLGMPDAVFRFFLRENLSWLSAVAVRFRKSM